MISLLNQRAAGRGATVAHHPSAEPLRRGKQGHRLRSLTTPEVFATTPAASNAHAAGLADAAYATLRAVSVGRRAGGYGCVAGRSGCVAVVSCADTRDWATTPPRTDGSDVGRMVTGQSAVEKAASRS